MKPIARLNDMHICPMVTGIVPHVGGPIIVPEQTTVFAEHRLVATVAAGCVCVGPPDLIARGAATVFAAKLPVARSDDLTTHGGVIVLTDSTVIVGD